MQKTNKMIEDYSRSQERVQFIDVSTAMLDAQGKPRHDECPRLFIVDVNYQAGTSEPVRADAPIVVGPKERVIMLSPGLLLVQYHS